MVPVQRGYLQSMHAGRRSNQRIGCLRDMSSFLRLRNQSPTYLGDLNRYRQYPAGKLAAQAHL